MRGCPLARKKQRPPMASTPPVGTDKRQQRSWQCFACVCLGVAFIALCLCLGWNELRGTVISRGDISLGSVSADGTRFAPFTLDTIGRVYSLAIHSNLNQDEAWVSGVLEAADGAQLFAVQGDFWHESGPDWVEAEQYARGYFVLRQPGSYAVRLYVERANSNPGTVGYELRSRVLYPSYLGLFGVLMLIPTVFSFYMGSRETASTT